MHRCRDTHLHTHKPIKSKLETTIYMQNTCKVKKKKSPDDALWSKEPLKLPLSSFRVDHLLRTWGLAFSMVCIPSETLLEKTKFSFANSYQWEESSGLGIGGCVHLLCRHWDPIWSTPMQTVYAATVSASSCVHRPVASFGVFYPTSSFCLLFYRASWAPMNLHSFNDHIVVTIC